MWIEWKNCPSNRETSADIWDKNLPFENFSTQQLLQEISKDGLINGKDLYFIEELQKRTQLLSKELLQEIKTSIKSSLEKWYTILWEDDYKTFENMIKILYPQAKIPSGEYIQNIIDKNLISLTWREWREIKNAINCLGGYYYYSVVLNKDRLEFFYELVSWSKQNTFSKDVFYNLNSWKFEWYQDFLEKIAHIDSRSNNNQIDF